MPPTPIPNRDSPRRTSVRRSVIATLLLVANAGPTQGDDGDLFPWARNPLGAALGQLRPYHAREIPILASVDDAELERSP